MCDDCKRNKSQTETLEYVTGRSPTQDAAGSRQGSIEHGMTGLGTRIPQYTPLLVQMMFELYCYPDKRLEYLSKLHTLPRAQNEAMELLERAGIVSKSSVHVRHGDSVGVSIQYHVDEDALRAYVNAVCSVPLPMKHWVMP